MSEQKTSVTYSVSYFGEDADDVIIGGRNLYLGTKNFDGDKWINLWHWEPSEGDYLGLTVYGRWGPWLGLCQEVEVEEGEQYTFSFYAKGDENVNIRIFTVPDQADEILDPYYVEIGSLTSEFKRYSVSFVATSTGTVNPRVENSTNDSWVELCGLKFEKGNKPTDWTPAPEDIDNKVDNIQVGGRNLVLDSANHDFGAFQLGEYAGESIIVDDEDALSGKHLEIQCTNAGIGFYSSPLTSEREATGKTITYSFWAKCSSEKTGECGYERNGQNEITLTTDWQYYTHTFTANDSQYYSFTWYYWDWDVGDILYIRDFKTEYGNKPTDWTPAPEDVDKSIDDTNGLIDGLETRVGTSEGDIEDIQTKNNGYDDYIKDMNENVIPEMNGRINDKVTAEYVNGVKAQIELNGVTKIRTSGKGFLFDDNGLTIAKQGREMSTNIDEDGMSIYRSGTEVLTADSQGVNAYNLHAKTYLIVGETSRFEDFEKNGEARTGCFWIGE